MCKEIDTLIVSKLRPMCDAPKEGYFLVETTSVNGLVSCRSIGGGYFTIPEYCCDFFRHELKGWIPKPIYKPALTGE